MRDNVSSSQGERRSTLSGPTPRQRSIKELNDGRHWEFDGRSRPVDDAGPVAHLDDLTYCTATDLQAVLRGGVGWETLKISDGLGPDEDVEDGPIRPVSFALQNNVLAMEILHVADDYPDDEAELFGRIKHILQPLLHRHRMWLIHAEPDPYRLTAPWGILVSIGFHTRNRVLADLVKIGEDMLALLDAVDNGHIGREQIADLLRGGHAESLVGQAEGEWLEAKRQHYDLSTTNGKVALAQAVARFANAEQGGLVVVGLATKGKAGMDVIAKVTAMPHDPRVVRRYQDALEKHLYPPVDGLKIERITGIGGDLVLVDVPPQPEELKPFLVHGAVVGGRSEGAFISIVRRRGDTSIPITAPMIHTTLAAGRALLRRGELPPSDSR